MGAGAGKAPSLMNIQMELRKCCNHPFMVRGVEDHEVDQIVSNLVSEAQKGVRLFYFFVSFLPLIFFLTKS